MEKAAYLYPTSEEELRDAYSVDRSRLGVRLQRIQCESTQLRSQLLTGTSDGNRLVYAVAFYTDTAEPILDHDLERWLCDEKKLRGTPGQKSKVAYRVWFIVRAQFQQEGLAKEILPREEGFFRRWGAREVQTDAMYVGRWVWTRPQFGYRTDEFVFQTLQQQYRDWQRSRGSISIHQAQKLSDLPRDFLLSNEVNSLSLFKELS